MWFQRKQKNRRFRRDLVLEVKQHTRQARALRMRVWGVCLSVATGLLAVLALAWQAGESLLDRLVFENPAFAIQTIDVQTDGVLTGQQIRRWAGVKEGDNLFALDIARVQRDLKLAPLIREAAVERELPHKLNLRIMEREPIIRACALLPQVAESTYRFVDYYLDEEGYVMQLTDAMLALKQVPGIDQLPALIGVNSTDVPPGRPVESRQIRAALDLLREFERSTMSGRADLTHIDLVTPGVLHVMTRQGGDITFATDRLAWQLRRWRTVYDYGWKQGKAIKSLDLSVTNNLPVAWAEASAVPAPRSPILKPSRNRKKHV